MLELEPKLVKLEILACFPRSYQSDFRFGDLRGRMPMGIIPILDTHSKTLLMSCQTERYDRVWKDVTKDWNVGSYNIRSGGSIRGAPILS